MCSVAHPASRRHADTVHAALPLTGESTVCALDDKKNDTTAQSGRWATVWPFRALAGSSCLPIMTIDTAAPSLPPPAAWGCPTRCSLPRIAGGGVLDPACRLWGGAQPKEVGGLPSGHSARLAAHHASPSWLFTQRHLGGPHKEGKFCLDRIKAAASAC